MHTNALYTIEQKRNLENIIKHAFQRIPPHANYVSHRLWGSGQHNRNGETGETCFTDDRTPSPITLVSKGPAWLITEVPRV